MSFDPRKLADIEYHSVNGGDGASYEDTVWLIEQLRTSSEKIEEQPIAKQSNCRCGQPGCDWLKPSKVPETQIEKLEDFAKQIRETTWQTILHQELGYSVANIQSLAQAFLEQRKELKNLTAVHHIDAKNRDNEER